MPPTQSSEFCVSSRQPPFESPQVARPFFWARSKGLLVCRVLFVCDGGVRNWISPCCYYTKSAVVPRTKRVPIDQESQEPRRPPPQCKVRPAHSAEPHSGDLRGDFPNKPSNPHCPLPVFFSTKSFFELRGRKNLARERANPTAARFASARVHAQDQRPTHRRQMAQSGASPAGCWL